MPDYFTLTCRNCAQTFTVSRHLQKRKYCTLQCYNSLRPSKPTLPRLEAKTQKAEGDRCWLWTGGKSKDGYGTIKVGGIMCKAHRVAWELAYGPIPDDLEVLHNCPDGDNPSCVRPSHLWLGSQAENILDMIRKGRDRKARGERAGMAKLTTENVIAIRRAREQHGISYASLAAKYGLTIQGIQAVIMRKTWTHVS